MFQPEIGRVPMSERAQAMLGGQNVRLLCTGLSITASGGEQSADLAAEWQTVRQRWQGRGRDDVWAATTADAYVRLYRSLAIKVRDTPPSAVNLVIRFAVGNGSAKAIPSIHPVVDAGNVVQAATLIPVAVFDADCVQGKLLFDVAREGDEFLGFGFRAAEPVPPGRLVLRDDVKVLSEFCYRDSQTTAVRAQTSRLQIVIPLADGVSDEEGVRAIDSLLRLLARWYQLRS